MDFGAVLRGLRGGQQCRRADWPAGQCIALFKPPVGAELAARHAVPAHKSMTAPFIYCCSAAGVYAPWIPTCADLLACDWSADAP